MRTWHVHLKDGDGIPAIINAETFFVPAGERPVYLVFMDDKGRPCAAFGGRRPRHPRQSASLAAPDFPNARPRTGGPTRPSPVKTTPDRANRHKMSVCSMPLLPRDRPVPPSPP